jgi:hypothetical protein
MSTAAALRAEAGFDSGHYRTTESASLKSRIDRQHPEVPALSVRPNVDAGRQSGPVITGRLGLVEHEELTTPHQIVDLSGIGSIAALEEGFDLKRRIDERSDRRRFIGARDTKRGDDHVQGHYRIVAKGVGTCWLTHPAETPRRD